MKGQRSGWETYVSLVETEVLGHKPSQRDDARAVLQLEEEERQAFVQLGLERVVVAYLERERA